MAKMLSGLDMAHTRGFRGHRRNLKNERKRQSTEEEPLLSTRNRPEDALQGEAVVCR